MDSLISIGFKNGEPDFRVSAMIEDLTYEGMRDLRAMIPVAICQAENMWRRANDNQSSEEIKQ